MKVVTAAEMKELDKKASEIYAVPGLVLMDQAAKAVADVVAAELQDREGKAVLFCGKGNNGGDGFGAARWLAAAGIPVKVFLVGAACEDITGDAAYELNMLLKAGVKVESITKEEDLLYAEIASLKAAVIVDALLGTGFHGELRPLLGKVCELINAAAKPVVAVDIPTGVNADDGSAAADAVKAKVTVTMALLKSGLLCYPGKELAGRVLVAAIGMPEKLLVEAPSKKYYVTEAIVAELLPDRKADAHKGDAGRVVVVAGSPGFTGAAAMSSYAAVKTGSGLVSLLTPLSCQNVLSVKLTEIMVHGLLERMPGVLGGGAVNDILQRAAKADVLALGPGLGTSESTSQVIREVLAKTETPVVLDADGLTAVADHTELLHEMQAPKVLTPHPGELSRLTGLSAKEINADRIGVATKYAKEWNCVLVVKGAPTIVASPEGDIYINSTGCSAMATGGSGDVLTGIIASLAGQEISLLEAAVCGVYVHGVAGTLATAGAPGLAAGEMSAYVPQVVQNIKNKQKNLNNNVGSVYNFALKGVQ